jgi:hypothetical protein
MLYTGGKFWNKVIYKTEAEMQCITRLTHQTVKFSRCLNKSVGFTVELLSSAYVL